MEERNIQMMGAPFGGGGSFLCELNDTWDVDQKFLMPVVVHVFYNEELVGPAISEQQILDAISSFNENQLWNDNDEVLRLRIQLARIDAQGQCSSGINYYPTNKIGVGTGLTLEQCEDVMSVDEIMSVQWNPARYLNIFVVDKLTAAEDCPENETEALSWEGALGAGYPPFWPFSNQDGVIVTPQSFGYTGLSEDHIFITLEHEVGHYLGLLHTHGQGSLANPQACAIVNDPDYNCSTEFDFVCDTPTMTDTWDGCSDVTIGTPSLCSDYTGGLNPHENFMQYTYVSCPYYITQGQIDRVRCFLVNERWQLWQDWNHELTGTDVHCLEPSVNLACSDDIPFIEFSANSLEGLDYLWDFGDGMTSNDMNGSHVYEAYGTYLVSLVVTDECGAIEIFSQEYTLDSCTCLDLEFLQVQPEELVLSVNQISCNTFDISIPECFADYVTIYMFDDDTPWVNDETQFEQQFCFSTPDSVNLTLVIGNQNSSVSYVLSETIQIDCFDEFTSTVEVQNPCEGACEGVLQVQSNNPFELNWFNPENPIQSENAPFLYKVSELCEGETEGEISFENGCTYPIVANVLSPYPTLEGFEVNTLADLEGLLDGPVGFSSDLIINADFDESFENVDWVFEEDAGLIISEGASLRLNNPTLRSCPTFWKGVDVQSDTGTPGYLEINGGTIENAFVGIQTEDESPNYLLDGDIEYPAEDEVNPGYILLNNVVFLNNVSSLMVQNAVCNNENPEIEIRNCVFSVDDDYYSAFELSNPDHRFREHVHLNHTFDLIFLSNTFKNEMSMPEHFPALWSDRGVGIRGINGHFVLNTEENGTSSVFHGLQYGVHQYILSFPWNGMRVLNGAFYDNQIGVYCDNVCFHDIIGNQFTLEPSENLPSELASASVDWEGVYQLSGAYFRIAENVFNGASDVNPQQWSIGIRVRDTQAMDNELFQNDFSNLTRGIQAEGDNTGNGQFDANGLRFVCNSFIDCAKDITVVDFQNNQVHEVGQQQFGVLHDELGFPEDYNINDPILLYALHAKNTFTENNSPNLEAFGNFYNLGSLLSYWCGPDAACLEVENVLNVENQFIEGDEAQNPCNSTPGVTEIVDQHNFELAVDALTSKKEDWMSVALDLLYVYELTLDGGNPDELHTDIDFAWIDETWEMRTKLLNKSPYLSKETLTKVADKTDVFPHVVAFEIFLANPDILKKESFLRYLENKEQPMPAYLIDLLFEARGASTNRTNLIRRINIASTMVTQLAWKIEAMYYQMGPKTTLLFDGENPFTQFNQKIYEIEAKGLSGNSSTALLNLDSLLNQEYFKAQAQEILSMKDYTLMGIERAAFQGDVGTDDEAALETLANNFWFTRAGKHAMARLNYLKVGPEYFIPAVKNPADPRSASASKLTEVISHEIEFYPVPTDDKLFVSLKSAEQIKGEMQIVILSSRGEVLIEAVKPKHWEELVLNTASLSSGTYIIKCFSNSLTQSSSFVVVH
jgi:PKD repeat protein